MTLVGVVATVWLALTGQLGLYIHPRYFEFTAIMAVIGGVFALAALALAPRGIDDAHGHGDGHVEHEHDHDHETDASSETSIARRTLGAIAALVIVAASIVALLVFPPATLTAQTAVQRDVDRTSADLAGDAPSLTGADPSTFTIKDWALLIRQVDDPAAFDGQTATLTGFVAPAPGDPDDTFYVARFKVTCCAVDAQPIGVPVHLPGWKDRFVADDWVDATGGFARDPSGGDGLVLVPDSVEPTDEPEQPYVY
ncbi:TIGR03943 family protein [Agromyces protaetiae]|uniref:TIGR03943 family protein n=1 Tax=Agromyces protaetiae TaxID=2509455 RepID=A0A4P6FG21_9MICO|nr:TIGR03943 family protein [Agromyces protaetiae]